MRKSAFITSFLMAALHTVGAQALQEGTDAAPRIAGEIPLRKVRLYSSGVGFFEHGLSLTGPAELSLPFPREAVNDALKSLVIRDPGSSPENSLPPSVRYPSEDTLFRSLRSLRIDLSGSPGMEEILAALRGAEIETAAPYPLTGRIIAVERRPLSGEAGEAAYLTLSTAGGLRTIALADITSFSFTDPNIRADLNRALDILREFRNSDARTLMVSLPGAGSREVSLSYVIPAPVWKAAYRLDLGGARPLLQGWAIVDNGGDADWTNVELSLVTGRPVSFVQNLYPPYYLSRPTVPLAIAGVAQAETYDSGWSAQGAALGVAGEENQALFMETQELSAREDFAYEKRAPVPEPAPPPARASLAGGGMETALAQPAGDQFEFTLRRPVSLGRRQSAMLPLVETLLDAEKTLVFSGSRAIAAGGPINPSISAELTNTTGMKLPAGPITVFDGGAYAGDALIAFFPENEKRIISYGDDLSVTGSVASASSRLVSTVTISGGVMTITRKLGYEKTYTLRNASGEEKRLILEHPITVGTSLAEPASYNERTDRVYRFVRSLPANRELTVTVREERPLSEGITLAQLRLESLISYYSNQEIPVPVRAVLQKAAELKRKAEEAKQAHSELEARRTRLIAEQDRIRRNLEAAGRDSPQGQEYLRRLGVQDGEIDALSVQADAAQEQARIAQGSYESYLASLTI